MVYRLHNTLWVFMHDQVFTVMERGRYRFKVVADGHLRDFMLNYGYAASAEKARPSHGHANLQPTPML